MLDFCKNTDLERLIPLTYGRYTINQYGRVTDNFHGFDIPWIVVESDDGVDHYVDLEGTPYEDRFTIEKLIALTYKPINVPIELLPRAVLIRNETNSFDNPLHPRNFIWRFIGGIELSVYPGYRLIPGFTAYVVSCEGDVISTFTGERKEQYIGNTGYLSCRVVRDDGHTRIVSVHQLVALAWCDYGGDVSNLTVDHINGDRRDNHYQNLEWVTLELNASRANFHGNYGKKKRSLVTKDIRTGEVQRFESAADVARSFGVRNSSIFEYLHSANPNKVFKQTHLIWYDDMDGQAIDPSMIFTRAGSQPRSVLVKNIDTGEVKRYASVIDFVNESGLSRKRVYGNLSKANQKRYGDIIFKYEDDLTPWLI